MTALALALVTPGWAQHPTDVDSAEPEIVLYDVAIQGGDTGVTTGTVSGKVVDPEGNEQPGVFVSASSQALPGRRTAYTGANGAYKLAALPPGKYTIYFELEQFAVETEQLEVSTRESLTVDVTLTFVELFEGFVPVPRCYREPGGRLTEWLQGLPTLPVRSLHFGVVLAPWV